MEIKHGRPLIPVDINESSFSLLLDTGAWNSSFEEEVIKSKNMTYTGKKKKNIDVYGQNYIEKVYSCADIKIGKYFASYHEFLSKPFNELDIQNTSEEILNLKSGALGLDFFSDKVVVVDKKKSKCLVSKNISYLRSLYENFPGDWLELPFSLEDHCITFYVKDHNDPNNIKKFILDTGTTHSLLHDNSLQIQHISKLELDTLSIPVKLSNGVSFGYHSFIRINLSEIGIDGILGFDFFDKFIIIFDFINKKVLTKKYE